MKHHYLFFLGFLSFPVVSAPADFLAELDGLRCAIRYPSPPHAHAPEALLLKNASGQLELTYRIVDNGKVSSERVFHVDALNRRALEVVTWSQTNHRYETIKTGESEYLLTAHLPGESRTAIQLSYQTGYAHYVNASLKDLLATSEERLWCEKN